MFVSLSSSGSGGTVVDITSSSEEVSPTTTLKQSIGSGTKNKEQLDEEDVDPLKVNLGAVTYGDEATNLPYYHCGPLPSHDNPDLTELVLLHGAAFTKEDWKTSGILDMLCEINNEEDEGNLSIVALDLTVQADGVELCLAFDALVSNEVLGGQAATFVSPSASGKAIVSLAEMASDGNDKQQQQLARIVKAWITVASFAVLGASDTTLQQYKEAKIPILAIHGDQDASGKRVTEKLKSLNDSKGVELEGRHPVYLDSPEEFVQEVISFLDEEGL